MSLSIQTSALSLVTQTSLNKGVSLQPAITTLSTVANQTTGIKPSSLPPSTSLQAASFAATLYIGPSINKQVISYEASVNNVGQAIDNIRQADKAIASPTDAATAQQQAAARAAMGAELDSLQAASQASVTTLLNISTAQSAIKNVDVASATTQLAKLQVLTQSGIAALGQANNSPNAVLSLLRF